VYRGLWVASLEVIVSGVLAGVDTINHRRGQPARRAAFRGAGPLGSDSILNLHVARFNGASGS
jgi:hypothetical protein